MNIIHLYPNIERAITIIDVNIVTDKEYQNLKKRSKILREAIDKELIEDINFSPFMRYYIEQKIRNLTAGDSSTVTKKEILIANVILPDDIQIAEILNKQGYLIDDLKKIIRTRQKLKQVILNNIKIDKELQQEFDIYQKSVTHIVELFTEYFHIDDETIILNRICEILNKNPNYFESKITTNIRKK